MKKVTLASITKIPSNSSNFKSLSADFKRFHFSQKVGCHTSCYLILGALLCPALATDCHKFLNSPPPLPSVTSFMDGPSVKLGYTNIKA